MKELTLLMILAGMILLGFGLAKMLRNGVIISINEDLCFLAHFVNGEKTQANMVNCIASFRKIYSQNPTAEQLKKLDELEIIFRQKYQWTKPLFPAGSRNLKNR